MDEGEKLFIFGICISLMLFGMYEIGKTDNNYLLIFWTVFVLIIMLITNLFMKKYVNHIKVIK